MNKSTGKEYTKGNASALVSMTKAKGYATNEWITFLQAKELGLHVKKGEKGTRLVRVFDNDTATSDSAGKAKKSIKSFTVFNLAQCETVAEVK